MSLKIVFTLTVGFGYASVLGYFAHRLKLSPILGYLLAGYIIGPYSPGFVADLELSEQLAEIGVILMMLGVGLQFKWQDLLSVRKSAIPGALTQTLVSASLATLFLSNLGWPWQGAMVFGLGIGVASTVVMVRLLSDNHLLHSHEGHISIGWLIFEDLITVVVLLLLPSMAASLGGAEFALYDLFSSLVITIVKFIVLAVFMFTIGQRLVRYALNQVIKTKSHELFTLSIMAMTFIIAAGSAVFFGVSVALGAFIAGMVIGQTDVSKEVSSNAMPLQDVFVVIFFLSIGMLFNPLAIMDHLVLFSGILAIVLIAKPMLALVISLIFKYPFKTALTVSVALAQIGEFSFIVAEEALKLNIIPSEGYDVIIACSFVSISLNPLLFKLFKLQNQPKT